MKKKDKIKNKLKLAEEKSAAEQPNRTVTIPKITLLKVAPGPLSAENVQLYIGQTQIPCLGFKISMDAGEVQGHATVEVKMLANLDVINMNPGDDDKMRAIIDAGKKPPEPSKDPSEQQASLEPVAPQGPEGQAAEAKEEAKDVPDGN